MNRVSLYNRDMAEKDHPFSIVKTAFWDVDYRTLSWDKHRDFMIQRILSAGSMDMLYWLQGMMGRDALARWIQEKQGAGLAPRRLRFWQLILDLPEEDVNDWIDGQQSLWQRRVK